MKKDRLPAAFDPLKAGKLCAFILCLLLASCNPSGTPHSYLGIATNETDWPYRLRLEQTNGVWSGSVERRDTNGWTFWDVMEMEQQKEGFIKFKAKIDNRPDFRPGWTLNLGTISPKGFSGTLTGDFFLGDRAIVLQFMPIDTKPYGATVGNRPKP